MTSSRPRLAVVQVTRTRPENEAYNALVQVLNGRVWAMAEDAGWDVLRLAAEDLGPRALLAATEDADAVVIMGGEDISPSFYGGAADYVGRSTHYRSADEGQIALVRRAVAEGTPLLGICRGEQIINVALGGTLHQHLEEGELHRNAGVPITQVLTDHAVTLAPGSRLADALGAGTVTVRSAHHQAVDRVGDGLVVTGHSDIDELAEAIELPDRRFVLGVQWHPEADETSRLLASIVEEARARKEGRQAEPSAEAPAAG
jgi:putative glutamine amidotransferase